MYPGGFDLTLLVKSQNFSIFYFHIFHYAAFLWIAEEGKKTQPKISSSVITTEIACG